MNERLSGGTAGERHASEANQLTPMKKQTNNTATAVVHPRLVRPLPISGEADCPKCGCEKSVSRHNADWTCQAGCGFHELTDPDRETEQAAFEEWLEVTRPSGDAESVHRQWEESSAFLDLFNETNAESIHPETKH